MKLIHKILFLYTYSTLIVYSSNYPLGEAHFNVAMLFDSFKDDLVRVGNSVENFINNVPFNSIVETLGNEVQNQSNSIENTIKKIPKSVESIINQLKDSFKDKNRESENLVNKDHLKNNSVISQLDNQLQDENNLTKKINEQKINMLHIK